MVKLPHFSKKGIQRDRCTRDKDTGTVSCKRVRVNADGTEIDVAGFTVGVDGQCTPVADDSYENEEGQLEELEKKFLPKIVGKCKQTPPDF